MEQNYKSDTKDTKILAELDRNARQSNNQIGKKVGLSKEVVKYRVDKMIENKIIIRFHTVINYFKLGIVKFKLYLRFVNANKEKLEEIGNYLQQRQQMLEERKFIESLKTKSKIEKFISKLEPEMPRISVSVGNSPFKGPENAKITIVEFTDFECPFCSRAHETIEQVLKEYEGKIKFVRKDFPLAFHKNAMNAHLAANCAQDQKKYWEYTEKLWTNKDKLEVDNLKAYANELGFNTQEFNTCLDSQKYKSKIETDINEGQKYGVRGTPAFFINGKMLSGARPYGDFKEIIDKEL